MSDVRVSLAIMAHPKREHHVTNYLLPRLGADACVVWDRGNDRWDTGRRSLLAYDPAVTYHAVVQDDALVSARLIDGVATVAAHVPPDSPIGLYYGSIRPGRPGIASAWDKARRRGAVWVVMDDSPMWGVGLVVPTAHIDWLVEVGDRLDRYPGYDQRIAKAYRGVDQWFPLPSLVDHRSDGEPSLVRGRTNRRRVAYSFLGEDVSAADRDWSGPVVVVRQSASR